MKATLAILAAGFMTLCTVSTALGDTPAPASDNAPKNSIPNMPQLYYSVMRAKDTPPSIDRHPQASKVIDEGQDAVFTMIVSGFPEPEVNCTKNERSIDLTEVLPDGRPKYITTYYEGRFVLRIRQAKPEDTGEYKFNFKNDSGEAEATSRLLVMKLL